MKKLFSRICVFACAVALLPLLSIPARSDSVTDTISVHIGYFGWEEDQFVEKATFNWRELDDLFGGALKTHEVVYSYFSGSRTYLVAARGFYIRDLLSYAGVDFSSISRIDFFTKDQTVGAYRSFTKSSLIDTPRYYFPNLAANYDTGEIYPYIGDDIYEGSVRVESMLALEDYTEWDSVGYEFENLYDRAMFSASSRFHLFFGQLAPEEANTSSAAKYVYKLLITFRGTPVLSTDETNIELKVGSDFKMTVNVSAEDRLLDEYVKGNLIWSSSDESIVSVDSEGKLTVKAEGDAIITASFGEASVSAAVRVGTDGSDGGQGDGGSGTGSGSGSGSNATQIPIGDMSVVGIPIPENPNISNIDEINYTETSGMYVLSAELMSQKDYAAWVNAVLGRETDGDGNNGGGGAGGSMDGDAVQLILLDRNDKLPMTITFVALAIFFAAGFSHGAISFKRKL